jgi:nicotinamide-nucleotide amidase
MYGASHLNEINIISKQIEEFADQLNKSLLEKGLIITTAESCTGGLVSAFITAIDGSSQFFDSSFITYSNQAKSEMLSVSSKTLKQFGAVSEQVAHEMLLGAIENSGASIGISITGIAGPTGGTVDKPVGTVCFAFGLVNDLRISTEIFIGDRKEVRYLATKFAIESLIEYLKPSS